jgi:hypothetical protein
MSAGNSVAGRAGWASLQRSVGNASLERLLSSGSGGRALFGQPGDRHERQADQIAAEFAAQPASTSGWLESRLGANLANVRIHSDIAAADVAGRLGARAVTIGQDIYFGAGQFAPGSAAGRKLLAHELVHTVQQAVPGGALGRAPLIQRQPAPGTGNAPITAANIFPFPKGSRIALNRIMPDSLFNLLSSLQPDVGASLRAIDRQVATVTTATDDLFAATVAGPISVPGQGGSAATSFRNVTFSLRRVDDGTFTLSLTASGEGQTAPTTLFERPNLTPRRDGQDIVLSSGTAAAPVPELRVGPGAERGQTRVEAFSAPFLDQVPTWARSMVPERIDLLQLTALPDAPAGSARERQVVDELASRASAGRRQPRQQIVAGGGIERAAGQTSPLLTAAWQINFRPIASIAGFAQVPLELQILYAPPSSVLGSLSSGVQGSLSPISIPVNLRLVAGVGGGYVRGAPSAPGASAPLLPAVGPTVGVGAGVELGAWRLDVRYEHLFNLFEGSPGVGTFGLRAGRAF